jgi:TolA-binding protein
MNKPTTSGDDLLILARRGELPEAEQRRLEVYLGASPTSRALYELGAHYDTAAQGRQDDAEMIGRAIAAVCERRKGSSQRRSRRGWLIAIVAALSSVSAAAAAVTVTHWATRKPEATSSIAPSAGNGASGRRSLAVAPVNPSGVASPDAGPSETIESATRLPDRPPSERARWTSSRATASVAKQSAAQMFSEANSLRKAGRPSEAEQAYRRLQRVHAGSAEASVSHVLLGRILLREGRAAAACAEFEQYLKEQSRGNLAEEALQADAMCTRALGLPEAERAVWQRLLARFPGSIYADAARQRLKELDGANGSLP